MDVRTSLQRMFSSKRIAKAPALSQYTVKHAVIDEYIRDNLAEQGAIFREALEVCPEVDVDLPDGTVERKLITSGKDLNSDLFFAFHDAADAPTILPSASVQPSHELFREVMTAMIEHPDFKSTRARTRDDEIGSALAMMAAQDVLLGDEIAQILKERLERAEDMKSLQDQMGDLQSQADGIRPPPNRERPDPNAPPEPQPQGQGGGGGGQPDPNAQGSPGGSGSAPAPAPPEPAPMTPEQWDALKDLARQRAEARKALQDLASQQEVGLSQAAHEAIDGASSEAKSAAEGWANLPGNGVGQRSSMPPDEAITMARKWSQHPYAKQVADLMGRMERDFRFKHSTRSVGGKEVPIDVELGNDLPLMLPSELTHLAVPEMRALFYKRYMERSLLQFEMVGAAESGKGPFIMLLDVSSSMNHNDRHIWAKAVALSLLTIAFRERRAVHIIAFNGDVVDEWTFEPSGTVDLSAALDFASLRPSGGTRPLPAFERALALIRSAPAFRQADIVISTDGECGYGDQDLVLRDEAISLGVRINGISIDCNQTAYLAMMCTTVIPVYEMTAPSEATDMLVQTII